MGREVRSCCPGFLWQAGYERHKRKGHNVHWERRSLGVVFPDFLSGLGIFVLIGKESACNERDLGWIPGLRRSLEKGKATHSSILAWRIPWTTVWVGGMGGESQRVGYTERLSLTYLQKCHGVRA